MQAQQKLFLIAWSAVVVVFIGIMAIAYASLFPHFKEIGDWMVWLVRLLMVCAGCFAVAFTVFKIVFMYHSSKFVQHGEVVSYLGAKQPFVVSSIHEAAKIPRLLPAPPDEEPPFKPDEQDLINIYNNGDTTLKELAPKLGMTYYQAQKIYADANKRGLITRK